MYKSLRTLLFIGGPIMGKNNKADTDTKKIVITTINIKMTI